jgi:hypothetical protein
MANIVQADRIDALAQGVRTELAGLVDRMRDSVTWTTREISMAVWLISKATVRVNDNSVEIMVPAGRANEKLGYLLYACLERAWGELEGTALALEVDGYTRDNVHGLRIV